MSAQPAKICTNAVKIPPTIINEIACSYPKPLPRNAVKAVERTVRYEKEPE